MKHIILTFAIFCAAASSYAQVKKGLKYLEKKDYEAAKNAFEADLSNPKEQAAAEFSLAKVYSCKDCELQNYETAYDFAGKAIASAQKADAKVKASLNERSMGLMTMQKLKKDIVQWAMQKAQKENTSAAANFFLENYKELAPNQLQKITQHRNQCAYNEAAKAGNASAMESFWKQYAASCLEFNKDLHVAAQKTLFDRYIAEKSWNAYPTFAYQYPNTSYAQDSAAAVKIQVSVRKNNLASYKDFIKAYPTSIFAPIAVDSLLSRTLESKNVEDYDYFFRNHDKHPKMAAFWQRFYQVFCALDADCANSFYKSYSAAPKNLQK